MESVIACQGIRKTFSEGDLSVDVLHGIDFSLNAGEQVAIVGSSGSGKSTLLQIMGGLMLPSDGEIVIQGKPINSLSQSARGNLRNHALGFVYQFHHLLPEFSALENVAMPLLIRRMASEEALGRAEEVLTQVGLEHRLGHKPGELSGGERQRAAVARALVTRPACILADEPTGNLDRRTADSIHELMLTLNAQYNTAMVVVTHDLDLAERMQRVYHMDDGRLQH